MKSLLRDLVKIPLLGRAALGAYQMKVASPHFLRQAKYLGRWLVESKEYTNFTYELTDLNKAYLASFLAVVTEADRRTVAEYIAELEADTDLRDHLDSVMRTSPEGRFADSGARYGRRLGWYALARILKPRVIVETGVDKGLGACVLTAALLRNRSEGHEGQYYGTDINPRAGYLLQDQYEGVGQILYGDSVESLKGLNEPIDLFVNDSDHSAEYEALEYRTIEHKLADDAIVVGDNAHVTPKLLEFAERTGRDFLFFEEQPRRHWYPGAGIGVAYRKR